MANFGCKCGEVIHLPGEGVNEHYLIDGKDFFKLISEAEKINMSHDEFFSNFLEKSRDVFLCPKCKRLTIEEHDRTFTPYTYDKGRPV